MISPVCTAAGMFWPAVHLTYQEGLQDNCWVAASWYTTGCRLYVVELCNLLSKHLVSLLYSLCHCCIACVIAEQAAGD